MTTSLDQPVQEALEAPDVVAQVRAVAERAKVASRTLAAATRATKDDALRAMADALVAGTEEIVAANAHDLERGRAEGTSPGLLDRLALTPERVVAIAEALRELAALPDPVGEVVRGERPGRDLGALGDRPDLRGHVRHLGCRLHRLVERRGHRTRVVPAPGATPRPALGAGFRRPGGRDLRPMHPDLSGT